MVLHGGGNYGVCSGKKPRATDHRLRYGHLPRLPAHTLGLPAHASIQSIGLQPDRYQPHPHLRLRPHLPSPKPLPVAGHQRTSPQEHDLRHGPSLWFLHDTSPLPSLFQEVIRLENLRSRHLLHRSRSHLRTSLRVHLPC